MSAVDVLAILDEDRVSAHHHRVANQHEWSGHERAKAYQRSVEARAFVSHMREALQLIASGKVCDDSGREWDGFDKQDVICYAASVLSGERFTP